MKWSAFAQVIKQLVAKQSVGAWTVVATLLAMLLIALWIAYAGWGLGPTVEVPATGYIAMAVGITFSLAVGVGLMTLVFYSNRAGFDEVPVFKEQANRDHE